MDTFLCTNCGILNTNNSDNVCTNCQTEFDEKSYQNLITYAGRATKYGYKYRTVYEKQVSEFGEIRSKYSLLDPSNYWEWLAVASLSGIIGSVAWDIVKFVGKQIYNQITTKSSQLTQSDKEVLELISNNDELLKFSNYIRQYYNGNAKIPEKALKAILEEELVHSLLDNHNDEFKETIEKISSDKNKPLNVEKDFGDLLKQASISAGQKRREKPKLEELKQSMQILKKDIKKARKEKKKKRK